MVLKKVRCRIFGHKWRYNFKSMPSKAICSECEQKSRLNYSTMNWDLVNKFIGETRSNSELIKKWVR